MSFDWSYFDRIYCISTPEAYIRRCAIREIARKLQVNIDIRIFKRNSAGSNQGCGESHVSIIKEAYGKNFQRIIIVEDDIIISFLSPVILKDIVQFLKRKSEWDLFYFGAVPDSRKDNCCREREKGFYRIKSLCTHAYALNRNFMAKYQDLYDNFSIYPLDYIFRDDFELNSYARFPTQFNQETSVPIPQPLINFYLLLVQVYAYYIGMSIYHPNWKIIVTILIMLMIYRISRPIS